MLIRFSWGLNKIQKTLARKHSWKPCWIIFQCFTRGRCLSDVLHSMILCCYPDPCNPWHPTFQIWTIFLHLVISCKHLKAIRQNYAIDNWYKEILNASLKTQCSSWNNFGFCCRPQITHFTFYDGQISPEASIFFHGNET